MATTTPNLHLRLTPGLTVDALYNLERIDGAVGNQLYETPSGTTMLRALGDIILEPNCADVGGTGTGGFVSIGTAAHTIDALLIYAPTVTVGGDDVVLRTATQTLTNKTISGSSNTLSNIAYGSLLLTNSITTDDLASAAKKTLSGTVRRLTVLNGASATLADVTLNIDTGLLPSPLLDDMDKALIATGPDTATWQAIVATDEKLKISATDTTAGYLGAKVVAGAGIALAPLGGGSNETLQITCDIIPSQAANTDKVLITNGTSALWSDELKNKAITGGSILDVNATIATITSATYTLLATDNCKVLKFTNSGAITVTLPASFATGFQCSLMQMGTGAITCVAASGATLYNSTDSYTSAGGYAIMALLVTTAASWLLMGDVLSVLFPIPTVADIGKALVATGENASSWQPVINADEHVKISATDTTTSYLGSKIVAGAGISLTTLNPGFNEIISIVNTGVAPADYTTTFIVGDWVGPSIGYYTVPITHNLSSSLVEVDVWDAGNNPVMVDWTRTTDDIVTLRVPAVPNLRFAGSIWIKTT